MCVDKPILYTYIDVCRERSWCHPVARGLRHAMGALPVFGNFAVGHVVIHSS